MYQVVLNDFVILNSDISAGSVYSVVNMDFYDTNNEIVCKGTLNISIQFLSNKTSLKLVVTGNEEATGLEQSKFFEQYFADNGIRLKVNEIL